MMDDTPLSAEVLIAALQRAVQLYPGVQVHRRLDGNIGLSTARGAHAGFIGIPPAPVDTAIGLPQLPDMEEPLPLTSRAQNCVICGAGGFLPCDSEAHQRVRDAYRKRSDTVELPCGHLGRTNMDHAHDAGHIIDTLRDERHGKASKRDVTYNDRPCPTCDAEPWLSCMDEKRQITDMHPLRRYS